MGVNLWGESPLYVNPVNVNVFSILAKVLADGKSKIPSFFRGRFREERSEGLERSVRRAAGENDQRE